MNPVYLSSLFCNQEINNYFNDKTLSEQREFQQNLMLLIVQLLRIKITEWPAFWNEEW